MSVSQGNIHKYIGTNLDYMVSGIARISMLEYIDDIMTAFNKMDPSNSVTKYSATPDNPFKVDEDCEKIITEKDKGFHNLVTKTLYT